MKLVNFFENSKPGSGFQEPSESGCLGKQIKKGKAKKKSESVDESFQYYDVRHKPSGKVYKRIAALSQASAKTKAAVQHGGRSASAYSGTSDDQFEIVEGIQEQNIDLEEMDMPDLSDDMIGTPDDYYDAEQRKEAYRDMIDAIDDCRYDWQRDTVIDGICPECSGSSCMDGDEENGEDSCYGWGNFGCDGGELNQNDDGLPNWAEIIKQDKRAAERKQAKDNYPGDDAVIQQAAKMMPNMDDPRMIVQQIRADYPTLGRAKASELAGKAKQIAFPDEATEGRIEDTFGTKTIDKHDKPEKDKKKKEDIDEGEEPTIIHDAMVEYIVKHFNGYENNYDTNDELEFSMGQLVDHATLKDIGLDKTEVGGQPIENFTQSPKDVLSKNDVISDAKKDLDIDHIKEIKKLSGIKSVDENLKDLEALDLQVYKGLDGKIYKFYPNEGPKNDTTGKNIGMFRADDGMEALPPIVNPKQPSVFKQGTKIGIDLMKQRIKARNKTAPGNPRAQKQKPGFFGSLFNDIHEDSESDASQVAVSKMIAKALGDENRWTEMSAAELYAELESTNTEMADMVKDVAKMIYGVRLAEGKTKYHDSSDCGCECGMPICKACKRPHRPEDIKEGEGDFYSKLMNLIHDEEAYAKACGLSMEKLDHEMNEIARDRGLHMDDDRHAIIMKHAEDQEEKKNKVKEEITLEDNQDFHEEFGVLGYSEDEEYTFEAEYQGRTVKLNKPTRGDVKKFKVYVKDPKTGNVKKVNFGHGGTSAKRKTMRIRKSNPKARKSFRARHNCSNPGPKTKARYWSCRKW